MKEQQIFILGYEEIVLLFGLLGIDGKVVDNPEDFSLEFNNLIQNRSSSISIIIIALELPLDIVNYIIDYKLSDRKPFVFLMPDIFQSDIDSNDIVLKEIQKPIRKLIS